MKLTGDLIYQLKETYGMHMDFAPENDVREHIAGKECWCQPKLIYCDPNNNNEVYDHYQVQ